MRRLSRIAQVLVPLALVATGLASCVSDSSFAPSNGLEVAVDSSVYHLTLMSGGYWYQMNMNVTIVNNSDKTVYLSQDCGSWSIRRANGDPTRLLLGEYGCADIGGVSRPAPLAIAAGDSYSKPFRIEGTNSPQTRPKITIEDNIGTLVFSYVFTNPDGTGGVSVRSAPFVVAPPN